MKPPVSHIVVGPPVRAQDYAIEHLSKALGIASNSLFDLVDEAVRRLTPAPPVDPYAGHPELPFKKPQA
jgi:hypothetical protein